MKNILKSLLAIAFMAALSSYANAQSKVKICFQTNLSNVNSCQDVTAANPLPSTATISGLSALSVTITNTAAIPVIVSNPNGLGGAGGPSNVTITNTAAIPAIVSCTNCGAASITNVTEVNSANILSASNAIAAAAVASIPSGTNAIGGVTVLNTLTVAAHNVSVTNSPSVTPLLATASGWTTALLKSLTTTVTTVKNGATQIGKIYCANRDATNWAYIQVFNALPGSVTLGTTTPANSYGIGPNNAGGFTQSVIGDQYATAVSVAATTTVSGLTAPNTLLDCNISYN